MYSYIVAVRGEGVQGVGYCFQQSLLYTNQHLHRQTHIVILAFQGFGNKQCIQYIIKFLHAIIQLNYLFT